MNKPKSLKFSPSSEEFEKILSKLGAIIEKQNIEIRKLNLKLEPIRQELDEAIFRFNKVNSLFAPTISLSRIPRPKDWDEDKKQLDEHIRGRVKFTIDGETINIPVYIGEVKKLKEQYPGVKDESPDWYDLIQKIAMEKSFTRLKELKPRIFDPYLG